MPTHRGIGAQNNAAVAAVRRAIERLAHAMQALMFDSHIGALSHAAHRRQGMSIVGRELSVEIGRRVDQGSRGDKVTEVG